LYFIEPPLLSIAFYLPKAFIMVLSWRCEYTILELFF
jgi:hypothetical protein